MTQRFIFLVDMQSFYAAIEKADRPALRNRPVVVSGDPKRRSGVILAACPLAKAYGIQNADTLWQAQQKCSHLTVIRPRMQRYVQISLQLTKLLQQFSDRVEPYSIDEQFIDLTGCSSLFGTPQQMAETIQQRIWTQFHLHARIGISENKVLAKMACDQFAKKHPSGIFHLSQERLAEQLWPLPIHCLFGVGRRMSHHLRRMGIRTIGELAKFPCGRLEQRWGLQGKTLWMYANGQDPAPVEKSSSAPRSVGHMMTLPRDYYTSEEIRVVLYELCEEVCRRARRHHLQGKTVSVYCRAADFDRQHGFSRQLHLPISTNHAPTLFPYAWRLFAHHWDRQPIRAIGVSLSSLETDRLIQLNLFHDPYKARLLDEAVDQIKERFGHTAILYASSLLPSGQARVRAQKIGGHDKGDPLD